MQKRRPSQVPQLQADILEEERAPGEGEGGQVGQLSTSGHAFRFMGIAGMYEVTPNGMVLRDYEAEPTRHPVRLRCHYSDLDVEHGRLLGAGASGKVFAVRHKPSGVCLALKKISVLEPDQMLQIQRELDTLYMDSNEYVVGFYGAFFDKGHVLIALELMDGCLLDAVTHMKTIPETVLRGITRQVLHGLDYLHKQRHVVHRDLKPSNILFARDGAVKITDFGISTTLQDTLVQANTFVGTVQYMSPERLAGNGYSYPSDIWALGITLVFLATGHHPFSKLNDKASFWDVLKCIEEEEPPTLPADRLHSASFRSFLAQCVCLAPEARATVRDLLAHPFISDMADDDARDVCREWFPQVRRRMKNAEAEGREQMQRNMELAERLLQNML